MTRLTNEVKQAILADLETVFANEKHTIDDKTYADGLVLSLGWMAGNYSSKGAWFDVVIKVIYTDRRGKEQMLWNDVQARTPRGMMRVIKRWVDEYETIIKYRLEDGR